MPPPGRGWPLSLRESLILADRQYRHHHRCQHHQAGDRPDRYHLSWSFLRESEGVLEGVRRYHLATHKQIAMLTLRTLLLRIHADYFTAIVWRLARSASAAN